MASFNPCGRCTELDTWIYHCTDHSHEYYGKDAIIASKDGLRYYWVRVHDILTLNEDYIKNVLGEHYVRAKYLLNDYNKETFKSLALYMVIV